MCSHNAVTFSPTYPKNALCLACGAVCALLSQGVMADFIADKKITLSTTNIYFNRDYRNGPNDRKEWGQNFVLDARSGFTEGTVGFGLDAIGWLGVKLDSSPDRTRTGLLPRHDDGYAADEYSRLGLTGKVKLSATELRYGSHVMNIPLVVSNSSRLMPQTYEGLQVGSREWNGLTLSGGRLSKVIARDSTNTEKLQLSNSNGRYAGGVEADNFAFGGIDYRFNSSYTARYWYGELDDIYRQHFLGFITSHKVGSGTFKSDWRLSLSKDTGKAKGGKVDNRAFNTMLSYKFDNGHALSAAWQKMSGDTGFAMVAGSDPFLHNYVQIGDFANAGERSWQARYDYDFAAIGVPGLTFMTRYVKGEHGKIGMTNDRGKEWERNVDIRYTVPEGVLKNFYVRWRNGVLRTSLVPTNSQDENRLYIGYAYTF